MNVRLGSFLVALAVVVLVAAFGAAPAAAQQEPDCEGVPHCGPYNEDPAPPCFPNDPFCGGGGGGGGSPPVACWGCEFFIGVGYVCTTVDEGRSECNEYPSQSCWPEGAFCLVIVVEG